MRKLLALAFALWCGAAAAQNVTNHAVPVGRGTGVSGFGVVGPCTAQQTLVWPNNTSDPACGTVAAGGIVVGTSTIGSGTPNGLLYDNAGVLGNLATGNNGVLVTDGSGVPSISSTLPANLTAATPFKIKGSSTGTNAIASTNATASNFTLNLPNLSDTLAVLGSNQTFTATQTFSGTLNASGTFQIGGTAVALPISIANGGTNASLSLSNGGMVYSTAAALAVLANPGVSNQCLLSQNAAAPIWGSCSGGATVGSVSNADGTLVISPTTGAVVASLSPGHPNTWTGIQTFTNSLLKLLGSSTGATTFTSDNAGASNFTLHFPAVNDTLATLGGASQTFSASLTFTGNNTFSTGTDTFSGTFNCTGTCQLSGTPFGTFATANAATPPAIGGSTPAAGTFTALTVSAAGSLTLSNILSTTQCLQVNASGVVSGTGTACGTGGGGGNVTGPGSSIVGDVVTFNNTSGNLIADSGILASNITTLNTAQTLTGTKTIGPSSAPAPLSNGQGALWGVAASGLIIQGHGSGTDLVFENNAGSTICSVAATTTILSCTSLVLSNALLGDYGGTGVANTGKSITLGASLVTTGAGAPTLAFGASPATITFPTASATLASLTTVDQILSGGANVTAFGNGTFSSGTFTPDCGKGPLQTMTNNGAFTFAVPSSDGSCIIMMTNGASAVLPTFSGYAVGTNTGDALNATPGNIFHISVWKITGNAHYSISASQ